MLLIRRGVPRAIAIGALTSAFACSKPAEPPPAAAAPKAAAAAPSNGPAHVAGKVAQASGTVVVMLEPKTATEFPPQDEKPVMDQVNLTFTPEFLFVRTNEPTEFRNNDDTLHNVHVTHEDTREPQFNVAIPTGNAYPFTFKRDGFYRVGCDIHPAMSAVIFAASTPFVAVADVSGAFEFDNVPPGTYVVTVYSGGRRLTKDVQVAGPTDVTIAP